MIFKFSFKKGVTTPADCLSHTHIDDVAAIQNAKAITAPIDSFTPTLVEKQAAYPDMIKFKELF